MKTETIQGAKIACYDNGGKTCDRFTVVYFDEPEKEPNTFAAVGMNSEPFHPIQFVRSAASAVTSTTPANRIFMTDLLFKVAWSSHRGAIHESQPLRTIEAAQNLASTVKAKSRTVVILKEHDKDVNAGKFFTHLIIK